MLKDISSINIELQTIGIVHSPFISPKGTPIQPCAAEKYFGKIEIFDEFIPGLQDLEGFSHIIVLYWMHEVKESQLHVIPFLDNCEHGIFATRSPARPNKIGMSILPLFKITNGILEVGNLDIINGTPVLDLKPYIPEFDIPTQNVRIGWFENKIANTKKTRDDGRFT